MTVFSSASFAVAVDTALAAYGPEVGGGFVQHPAASQGCTVLSAEGRARGNSSSSTSLMRCTAAPPGVDYRVAAVLRITGSQGLPGVLARLSADAATYYQLYLTIDGLMLERVVAGAVTLLGSHDFAVATNTDYAIEFDCADAGKRVRLNGVERIASADNGIAAAGFAGLRARSSGRIDNFIATALGGGGAGLVPGDGSHATRGAGPGLASAQALSPRRAVHAQRGRSAAVGWAGTLAAADGRHAHRGGAGVVGWSAPGAIAPADARHATRADQAALTATGGAAALAPARALHPVRGRAAQLMTAGGGAVALSPARGAHPMRGDMARLAVAATPGSASLGARVLRVGDGATTLRLAAEDRGEEIGDG